MKSIEVSNYISGFPENISKLLEEVRSAIRKSAPEATEK